MRGRMRVRRQGRQGPLNRFAYGRPVAQSRPMSIKSRHTRHRAKASVSPRATRLSVKKTARQRPKPKAGR